ncbi:hypothetical protein [Pseudoduganella namucuonensis]|uniref:DUF2863 family protein n=1 Tax=Pseudoduganella namucuonensis TaxID=1035707 RepID=A0A1I7JVE9_9BURK|nr:hypothetical protein [Pseudoduganella namucuonensis]SFU89168.1 hypothetical protein SAMN05216552_101357 [Pseudoduganella namucuonensis]
MPKNKRPAPRKNSTPPEDKDETLSAALCALALELAEREEDDTGPAGKQRGGDALAAELRQKQNDFVRQVRKYVQQQKDELLYSAVELARFEDVGAYRLLSDTVEEAAGTIHIRREGAPDLEVNAFAIPVFVHSAGGLAQADEFQDEEAFDALRASFNAAGLESPDAKVVLVRHAYDLGEINRVTFGQLNAMVREAAASMTEKKLSAAPALERSMGGWSATAFGPGDSAVELRMLLGFALKRVDDAFYQAPEDEQGQDDYYAARMERYRQWTVDAAPLVRRCLARGERAAALRLNFLYQDLFFSAREQALAEHATLEMMAQLGQALAGQDGARAVIAPADARGDMMLRVNLYPAGDGYGQPLASCDKPIDLGCDLQLEVDDVADALATIGLPADAISVASLYDAQGRPVDPQPLA